MYPAKAAKYLVPEYPRTLPRWNSPSFHRRPPGGEVGGSICAFHPKVTKVPAKVPEPLATSYGRSGRSYRLSGKIPYLVNTCASFQTRAPVLQNDANIDWR